MSRTHKALSWVKESIRSRLVFDRGGGPEDSLFLAATGRSGSTWISELINCKNEYRYIFEPLFPRMTPICSHFNRRQYLRPENSDPAFLEPVRAILSGKIRSRWTNTGNKRFICSKRLIKAIRANLMLRWLQTHFPEVPIILLLRHPCAVANSRLKLGRRVVLDLVVTQEELIEDYLEPFKKEIREAKTDFEKHVFEWCIENYVAFKQVLDNDKFHLTFYESFCVNPEEAAKQLFSFLGKEVDAEVIRALKRPSRQSKPHSSIISGDSLVESWRKHITEEQTRRAVEILGMFGLDKLYSEESMPHMENVCSLIQNGDCERP